MALDLLTIAGVAGSALIVFAYFANQQEWLRAENWPYSLANLVGAVLILVYSAICSPDPPISAGKSLNFGSPSRMGRTVSA